jgi:hypothetical protein
MRVLMALIDLLRGATGSRRLSFDDYMKPALIVLIALLAGPEIFAAIEMTAVLELLGATLFLLSFAVALRMFAGPALQSLKRLLLPCECVVLLGMRAWPSAVAAGVFWTAVAILRWFAVYVAAWSSISQLPWGA